jgi:hypothetical protein
MTDNSQFIHLGANGRAPRKGAARWSCISGITAEAARVPGACNHLRYRGEPNILYGGSPLEAGRRAIERADQAVDATGVRRLRCDGIALLAGVASYPIPRQLFYDMPAEGDVYCLWRTETCDWLRSQFGEHLHSIVEHADEQFMHIHFFAVPTLLPDRRLNVNDIHPGRRMKVAAAEAGASKRYQDAAYRSGMSRWQDTYHYDVSRRFGHNRHEPKRARVSRMQHMMEKRMEEAKARQEADLAAERAAFERTQDAALAELDRERARITADAQERAWQTYAKPHYELQAAFGAERARREAAEAALAARTRAADAELAALRERLAELEPAAPVRLVD